jgi:hypothetical protein
MGSTDSFKPKDDRPFLLNWMAANIVGLPILLGPYSVGVVLLTGTAILSDGGSIRLFWHVSMFMILALCGAVMGAYLGHMQSLSLKTRIPQTGKWIGATSLGVAIGAPLSWLAYLWILDSTLVPNGVLFFFLSQYVTFSVLLGLSVGAAQWCFYGMVVTISGETK